jgi:hypothetical protein
MIALASCAAMCLCATNSLTDIRCVRFCLIGIAIQTRHEATDMVLSLLDANDGVIRTFLFSVEG